MTLRKIEEQDLELMLSWRNHPAVRKSMFSQTIVELDHHLAWFQRESAKDTSLWFIYVDSQKQSAGIVYFTDINRNSRNAFWGFYAAPEAERGTGTNMAREALNYFFRILKLHKLSAEVLASNERSQRFHLKLGFQLEGVFRDAYWGENRFQNVLRFGLMDSEWQAYLDSYD